jgi:hypothetical protein
MISADWVCYCDVNFPLAERTQELVLASFRERERERGKRNKKIKNEKL